MATKVIDKFTKKEKILYTDKEKFDYHYNRVQGNVSASETERAYSAGWLKRNKKANKDFREANPNYQPKGGFLKIFK